MSNVVSIKSGQTVDSIAISREMRRDAALSNIFRETKMDADRFADLMISRTEVPVCWAAMDMLENM